ncbi:MAG: T9SS type A sorting domain-containing protein [Bacteroidota bacterium]|nr:T9SS type A sorting domain-containing protein [Bacteroidota bacterium]
MKQTIRGIVVFMAFLFWVNAIQSQPNIIHAEYYIDTDPGYGNATIINITPSPNLSNIGVDINTSILNTGVHLFGIRAKDAKGAWSLDNKLLFVKMAIPASIPDIIQAEYYIDSDPGYGNANMINITPGTNLSNITTAVNLTTLSTGVHLFGIRAKDANGAWSLDNKWLFVKSALPAKIPNITQVEYYIDKDPGYNNASPLSITPGTDLPNLIAAIDLSTLSTGVHLFGVRAKDENGAWSLDNKWLFVKNAIPAATPNIVRVEYYVDTDPGYGNALQVAITPSTNLAGIMQNVAIGTLQNGAHFIGIRALDANGAWSLDNKLPFSIVNGPLPITISNFYGHFINNANELKAVIAQAINVKEIQVERSGDGNNFRYVGLMAAGQVSAGTYTFDDLHPLSGNNFYRLRIVDNDGTITYSIIILLTNTSGFVIQAYPNPVTDNLIVHFQNAQKGMYDVSVTDAAGKLLFKNKISVTQQGQSGEMNISFRNYSAGVYYLRVSDAMNKINSVEKIIRK